MERSRLGSAPCTCTCTEEIAIVRVTEYAVLVVAELISFRLYPDDCRITIRKVSLP